MKRFCKLILLAVIGIIAVWGYMKKRSYRDITKEKDYLDRLQVAEIPDEFAKKACSQMEKELPKVPVILRVTPSDDVEHIFNEGLQKVKVREVYKGKHIKAGDEINLYSRQWHLVVNQQREIIERGFVNVLRQGDEYLVFLSRRAEVPNRDLDLYETYDDTFIVPVFNYKQKAEKIAKVEDDENTYVPYREVKENELFAMSAKGFEAWNDLKSKMLMRYN